MMKTFLLGTLLALASAAHAQDVTDITPAQQPPPKPKFRIVVDATNTAPLRTDIGDVISRSNKAQTMSVRLGVKLRADGTVKGGALNIEADLSGAAARNLWLSLENGWAIPAGAKTNLMGRAKWQYTNSGAAEMILEYR